MMDFVGKAKWSAWSELGKLPKVNLVFTFSFFNFKRVLFKEDAEKQYIDFINELCKSEVVQEPATNLKFKEILTSIEYGNIYKIVLNRPNKRNALNLQVCLVQSHFKLLFIVFLATF